MPEVFTISGASMGLPLGAASAAVKSLQDALRALGTVTGDSTLAKVVPDGLLGPATAAAMNRAFTTHIGPGQATARLRTGTVTTAGISSELALITSIVLREIERRTGAEAGSITPATVASKPLPKSTTKKPAAAPRSPEISPEAISAEPSFFARPGVKIGVGVGAGVLLLSVIGVLLAKKPASPTMAGDLGATRKDYVAFANMLCRHGASSALVGDVSDYFQRDNPRFARGRFLEAAAKCTPIRRAA